MTATYRLQFTSSFTFSDARKLVDYLSDLGVTTLYASPLFECKPGSTHGYDVTNPQRLNPELGSESDFDKLTSELRRWNLGLLLDIVPNHMSAHHDNKWWVDLLEYGTASSFEHFFDVSWGRERQIILPVLGSPIEQVIDRGELDILLDEGRFWLTYFNHRFPVTPHSYAILLETAFLSELKGERRKRLESICAAFVDLPTPDTHSHKEWRQKAEKLKLELKHFLSTLTNGDAAVKESLGQFPIRLLLEQQAYQLLPWQEGLKQINYRRFFNIADLVAVRVENPSVFEATHKLVFRLIGEGKVTGLRVDHIDGLFDPREYLEKLRARSGKLYLLVEKILLGEEKLPPDWPVEGTTGYEFLNEVNGIFVDPAGLRVLKRRYQRDFAEEGDSFEAVAHEKKRRIINRLFKAELKRLGAGLRELAAEQQAPRFPPAETTRAIQEVTAALPVYRTYINSFSVSKVDRQYIEGAVGEARRRGKSNVDVLNILEKVLLLNFPPGTDFSQKRKWLQFVMKWQQFTGPVAAKGVEDTALYVYNPLASLNEVGGEPDMAVSLEEFHALNKVRAKSWPRGLNASTTHDTKRSEDVRARINVLSELADEWQTAWQDWHSMNKSLRRRVKGRPVPERNMELLLYTSLLGVWPLTETEEENLQERIEEFVIKAAREGKTFTSWMTPDQEYEEALLQFVRNLFASADFLQKLKAFQNPIAFYGMLNSLSQLILKIFSPGIPDFYQGTELWNLSLVDPDNRRPVDFDRRRQILCDLLDRGHTERLDLATDWLKSWKDGRIKLLLTHICLSYRKREPALFLGDYEPLRAEGEHRESVCAFLRRTEEKHIIVIAPRWWTRIVSPDQLPFPEGCWKDTRIRLVEDLPERWQNVLTSRGLEGEAVESGALLVDRVLRELPVALLEG